MDAFEAAVGEHLPGKPHPQPRPDRRQLRPLRSGHRHRAARRFPRALPRFARREHRWVRGDWQISAVARSARAGAGEPATGQSAAGPGALEDLDNLRRSLVPPALVVLLVLGWTVLPGSPWFWTAGGSGASGLAAVAPDCRAFLRGFVSGRPLLGDAARVAAAMPWQHGGQVLLAAAFLLDQARLYDRRDRPHALPAVRHAAAPAGMGNGGVHRAAAGRRLDALSVARCGRRCSLAAAMATARGRSSQPAAAAGAPLLLAAAWLASPLVAFWVSRPRTPSKRR